MDKTIFYIAKKEIMDNIRNMWIILVTVIFSVLALMVSYFGSMGQGWQNLQLTIFGMHELVKYLVPIISLMLGYGTIVKEIDSGSLNSLISFPIKRWEIVLGKFIGLGSVLSFCIFVGFGISGLIIGVNVPNVNYLEYLVFILDSILIGLVFLSISMLFSTIVKSRAASIGLSILYWFIFVILWPVILIGVLIAIGGNGNQTYNQYFALDLINPITPFSKILDLNIGSMSTTLSIYGIDYPSFYTSELMVGILLIWIIIPLLLTFLVFRKKDI